MSISVSHKPLFGAEGAIEAVFYINLARRPDRRTQMEEMLTQYGISAERFEAIDASPEPGIIGCTQSHRDVLALAAKRGYRTVLILEDDFIITVPPSQFHAYLQSVFKSNIPFDVFMLSYHIEPGASQPIGGFPLVRRVGAATLASGYIVRNEYISKLVELYDWALPKLRETGQHWIYANDQCWKRLQSKDNWICSAEKMGIQRDGYSDNVNRVIQNGTPI